MTYIIEYEQKKGTWARSYNPTKTMQHSRSLNHYEFTDRSLAEWEAKAQMSSGTNFAYRVTEVREISDEADFDPLGVDEALASLTDAIAREYENDKNNDYSKQIKELNERVDKVGSSSLAALMSANEDHKHYVAVTEEIIDRLEDARLEDAVNETGWVVVDTTWQRGPLNLSKDGWLATSKMGYDDPTVFLTREDAEKAIADTHSFMGGGYAWSHNKYVAVEVR